MKNGCGPISGSFGWIGSESPKKILVKISPMQYWVVKLKSPEYGTLSMYNFQPFTTPKDGC